MTDQTPYSAVERRSGPRRLAFTKKRLQALQPPNSGRVYYNDTTTAGLCLCITDAGTKTFYFTKNVPGKTERIRLGTFPAGMTIEQARTLASSLNVAVAGGHDPQEAKRERRAEPTLTARWEHWLAHARERKRPRSVEEDERLWRLHLGDWGSRQLSTIRAQDVAALHSRMGKHVGRYRANAAMRLLRAMFNRADRLGWKGDNPVCGIAMFPEQSRDRFLLPNELPQFPALYQEPNPLLQGFFLLALTTRRQTIQRASHAVGGNQLGVEAVEDPRDESGNASSDSALAAGNRGAGAAEGTGHGWLVLGLSGPTWRWPPYHADCGVEAANAAGRPGESAKADDPTAISRSSESGKPSRVRRSQ